MIKDIFALFAEEKELSKQRIANALCEGIPTSGYDRITRSIIADGLYHALYDGRHYQDVTSKDDVLETFCWNIFHASFEEVIKAWDKYLG